MLIVLVLPFPSEVVYLACPASALNSRELCKQVGPGLLCNFNEAVSHDDVEHLTSLHGSNRIAHPGVVLPKDTINRVKVCK